MLRTSCNEGLGKDVYKDQNHVDNGFSCDILWRQKLNVEKIGYKVCWCFWPLISEKTLENTINNKWMDHWASQSRVLPRAQKIRLKLSDLGKVNRTVVFLWEIQNTSSEPFQNVQNSSFVHLPFKEVHLSQMGKPVSFLDQSYLTWCYPECWGYSS